MTSRPWLVAVLLVAGVAATRDAAAAPKDQKQCADAYLEAQKLRKEGKLLASKKQLELCAASKCLAAVKAECSQWMTEVDGELPSVTVKSAGDATLAIDGEAYAGTVESTIPLDPGKHVLVFTKPGGASAKREVTLKSGDKSVSVDAFPPPAAAAVEVEPPPPEPPKRSKVLPLALAGVGVAALVATPLFWNRAQGKVDELDKAGCAPNCTDKAVGVISRNRLLGDIALGVGIVSLGAAAYLFFTRPSDKAAAAALRGEVWPFVF